MADPGHNARMKNGTPYEVRPCLDPELNFTPQRLKEHIRQAMQCLSAQSRWQRFASAVHDLSETQLEYLTDLDGSNRVAWCAATVHDGEYTGIGLARYVRLGEDPGIAEFAVTVVDEFQGQGIGRTLMERLIESARVNGIRLLRGYVSPGNRKMLGLCRHLQAEATQSESCLRMDIPLSSGR